MEYILAKDHKIYRKHPSSGNYITYPMRVGDFTWIPQNELVALKFSEDLIDLVEIGDIVVDKGGVAVLVSKITQDGFESENGLDITRNDVRVFLKKESPIEFIKIF